MKKIRCGGYRSCIVTKNRLQNGVVVFVTNSPQNKSFEINDQWI